MTQVYAFVREDLTHPQQVVQVCHATMRMARVSEIPEEPPYVIVCSLKNEKKLAEVKDFLKENKILYEDFHESDLNDELTAVVTVPLTEDKKVLFRKYQLLRSGKCKV